MPTAQPPTQAPTIWQRICRWLVQGCRDTKVNVDVDGPLSFTVSKEPGSPWRFGKDKEDPEKQGPGGKD
jgi:hypothetical protein